MISETIRPRRSVTTSQAGLWFAAIILAMGWHALWWHWLRVERRPTRILAVAQPRVAILPVAHADEAASVLQEPVSPRSPALFALPVRGSFSEPLLRQTLSVRPPLALPVSALSSGRESLPAASILSDPAVDEHAWRDEIALVVRSFPLRADEEPIFVPVPMTGAAVTVTFDGDLSGVRWTAADLPDLPAACLTQSWEMVMFVEVGGDGRTKRVLLENRSPSALFDEALERKIRGWPWAEVKRECSGRVRIQASVRNYQPQTNRMGGP